MIVFLNPQQTGNQQTILFISSCWYLWGGSEELWSGAALELCKRGYTILAGRVESKGNVFNHPRWRTLENAGVKIGKFKVHILERILPDFVKNHFPSFYFRIAAIRNSWVSRRLKKLAPDLVVISQGESFDGMKFVEIPAICRLAGVPYVLICQRSSETEWPSDQFRAQKKEFFAAAQKVYFVSEHNRRLTQLHLGMPLPQSEVVRNPLMIESKEPLPWPDSVENIYKYACVGRLYPHDKGQDILLNVLAQEKWRDRPIEVNFFGEGPMAVGLVEMAAYLGLKNVRFCGQVSDITTVWKQHHALVLPSRSEGLALAQIEAMACGRVAIMAPAGGAGEVIVDGENGFLASAATEESMDAVMERAWQCRGKWPEIGRRAAESIKKTFPENPCAAFAEKLERLLLEAKTTAGLMIGDVGKC